MELKHFSNVLHDTRSERIKVEQILKEHPDAKVSVKGRIQTAESYYQEAKDYEDAITQNQAEFERENWPHVFLVKFMYVGQYDEMVHWLNERLIDGGWNNAIDLFGTGDPYVAFEFKMRWG